jgi:hypothetical protein
MRVLLLTLMVLVQLVIGAKPGLISYTAGDVYLDGKKIHPIKENYPFLNEGQLLRTRRGLAEMQLTPCVYLRMGEGGELQLARDGQGGIQVLLQKGAAVIEVIQLTKNDKIQIRCAGSNTELKSKGVYRFDADPGSLRVYGGKADVSRDQMNVHAESGKAVDLVHALSISKFSVDSNDSLHLWAARRSFILFTGNPEALTQQTHWELSLSGRSKNADFHISFSSPIIAREYARLTTQDAKDKAIDQEKQQQLLQQNRKP